jgi:uncharacterized BrkB/YihY/UPF0761 family membrane protein
MKGQVTFVNLLVLLVTFIVFFVLLPVLNIFIDAQVAIEEANPNEFSPVMIILLRIVPAMILLMIIITGLNYAIPNREGTRIG